MRDFSTALERLDIALERLDWVVKDVDIWLNMDFDDSWWLNIKSDLRWAERWTEMAWSLL